MRAVLAVLLLAAALWRAGVDWQATIGDGYAYRLGTIGGLISAATGPTATPNLVESLQASGVPFAWDPVGAVVMSMPLALVLAAHRRRLWLTRERARAGPPLGPGEGHLRDRRQVAGDLRPALAAAVADPEVAGGRAHGEPRRRSSSTTSAWR